ncbi:uncharacterized protein LOC113502598 isoform X14 [Trichoplusia ni]|uniref:Uncharacterized protein LOC113502598 isoform X14 n=1 Tax=Trichoplusia ni TaxID=7111 RepID=A0A7E5WH36_TRINI|nr:uncharacterized protein LOC113502598 isoform X14 [Trichoplusia ni]
MGVRRKSVLFTTVLLACINCSYGCAVTGAITPTLFLTSFRDVDRGTIIDTGTTNIIGMQIPNYGVDLGGTPYIVITFENNRVVVVTNHNYGDYEKYETATFISADVTFTCAPGSPQTSLTVTFRIDVVDTNNNAPEFIPSSGVVYTISTPVPPYYEITGCGNEIVVRDIDLTTNAVHFTVDNPDFEIQSVVPTERPKEFKAMLRTTTLIRSIPEDIVLRITATDEDLTGDPPLTTETMITIAGNRDFLMPDELGFSQTFYQHNYDINNNAIVPSQPIVLENGFDDKVDIFLYGGLSNHFKLDTNGNTATLRLETALPDSVFSNQYIFFEVRAEREDTIGTAATIIIQLPEARELMFEESSYRGSIQNNDIALGNIRLAVGYDEKVKFDLHGEFSTHFTLNDEKNGQVTLNVNPTIPENVILENNLIYLTVTASGVNAITTTTSILLDIIKADHTTPVFSRNIYYGTYLGNTIDIQNINLIQGFDKYVKFRLDGEHSNYFQISGEDNDMQLTLRPENIPEDVIFNEKVLVFNVLAEKALTVGAHAVIVIRFPPDLTNTAIMSFSQNAYLGKYENNELEVDQVVLTSGYAPGTEFIITGEYETYFQRSVEENTVSLALDKTLPTDTIPGPFIVLEIEARRERAASVWTSVIINIVEQEIVHPVFTNAYYVGIYNADTEVLQFDEIISLFSGFDDTVTFHLEGEHSDLFRLVPGSDTNSYKIDTKESLPKDLLLDRGHIILTVLARKPGANAAHSAIVIEIKKESLQSPIIRFERVSYVGSIENNLVNLVPIRLTEGYTDDVQFALHGALSEYFTIPNDGPVINLQLPTSIPADLIPASSTIVLDIRASLPETATTFATIVLDVITENDENPAVQLGFDAVYYTGSYGTSGLSMDSRIVLSEGFEEGVHFSLEGANAQWFRVVPTQNVATLVVQSGIPEAVLISNQQLVFTIKAERLGSITAQAAVVISLPDENLETSTIGFERVSYIGSIEKNVVNLVPIRLTEGYTDDVQLALYGALSEYFTIPNDGPVINLQLPTPIPADLIPASGTIVLDIRASLPETATTFATIVLDVITENDENPAVQLGFDAVYYTGSYGTSGLSMDSRIVLSEGFEEGVHFSLEGADAQWFRVVPTQNVATLVVQSGIPEAVLVSNQQLVFTIKAERLGSITAQAAIVISLPDENLETSTIGFERVSYVGSIENNVVNLVPITLTEGYTNDVQLALYGALSEYFTIPNDGPVINLQLPTPIPADLIPASGTIVLDIRASLPETATTFATIVLDVITENDENPAVQLGFDAVYYTGSYGTSGLSMDSRIVLSEGFEEGVHFSLEGADAQWFRVVPTQNVATLVVQSGIPEAVLVSNQQLVFTIKAERLGSITAQAAIVISLPDENLETSTIGFERVSYVGSIENNVVNLVPITLTEGYTNDVQLALYGALSEYFTIPNDGPVINLQLPTPIPTDLIPASGTIVLDIRASLPETATTFATIVLDVITENNENPAVQLGFDAVYYTGSYGTTGLSMESRIVLSEGFEEGVHFSLEGADAQWFRVVPTQNVATLVVQSGIPEAVLISNQQLVFTIKAERLGSITAQATVVISLPDDNLETSTIGFERVSYVGSIENNVVNLMPIRLTDGYTNDVQLALYGALSEYFTIPNDGPVINLQLPTPIPADLIPASGTIVLDIRASLPETATTFATIVLDVITENDENPAVQLGFDAVYYTGSYGTSGLSMDSRIVLSEGFEEGVHFSLEGADAQWFRVVPAQNVATLVVQSGIPEAVLISNQQLVFTIKAERPGSITARAAIVISLPDGSQSGENLTFEKVLYRGSIQDGQVDHEDIIVSGFDGTTVTIIGEHSGLFEATATNGMVTVKAQGSLNLPAEITRVDLELRAGTARAVLLLNVGETDPVPAPPPTVTFTSDSYAVSVEIVQTGIIGRVLATSDNEEPITYSLSDLNAHLQSRLSINNEGELFLSAPANSGVYTFRVIATTDTTEATATATVHLTVQAITTCGDEIVVPPLITLDRDEEEPHNKLVVLQPTLHAGCHFTLNSLYPSDQDWLFVDDNGLHARVIDREHPSIAFMTLSQVQVELILHCESDNNIRTKRSERTDWFSEIDYGTKNWILTDSIPYNSRRSLVNLIVNDINDNDPIFVGKEHEPIAVGYPIDELEERILPRSLAELKATDADIGWNAKLRYWSSESVLAVAPTTGFVHVQSSASLVNNQILTVHATDRNGEGNSGSIQLVVKLLTANNIAVVTVKNSFLDQEASILERLSAAVGYDVKTLRSEVISEDADPGRQDSGASLQLYVYGLISREPVAVELLVENINSNSEIVNVISTVSLEDHLEDIIVIQRNNGLLASTIALSILLFILMVLIAVWYYLRWRKNKSYDQFSDKNSIASRNESLGDLSKPAEIPPVPLQPRLNIDDLKKSERRLQEMLDAPIEAVTVEPVPSRSEPTAPPLEAILDISMPEINVPIVIQSIDKLKDAEESDDEFGEVGEVSKTPRKSVVTFNENVEKIIHVEDDTDNSSQSGYEIYKF